MKIAISTETSSDLSKELLEQYSIKTLPFGINLGDSLFYDGDFSTQKIFDYVREKKVLPKTNAVNEFQYGEQFDKLLAENDAVVHIALSSGISSACQNAIAAAKARKNVYVVDSESLSTGVGLLCINAAEMAAAGVAPEKIVETLERRRKSVQASFVLDTLDYLYKGGRCSALTLFGANLLKIRPQILVSAGKMAPSKKYRDKMPQCVEKYCIDTLTEFNHPDMAHVFITHAQAEKEEIDTAYSVLKAYGFTNIHTTIAGSTISSHCGQNCLGILYINDAEETVERK